MPQDERRWPADVPRMADHHHAVCLSAVRQHFAAQPPHRYLQVSKQTSACTLYRQQLYLLYKLCIFCGTYLIN